MECLKVLVVHRQVVLLDRVNAILERFEPKMRCCNCGIDGLQAAKLEHFNLILCGIDLPLITGFEMVRSIRNLSRNSFTPVVFISQKLVTEHFALSRVLGGLAIVGTENLEANLLYVLDNAAVLKESTKQIIQ